MQTLKVITQQFNKLIILRSTHALSQLREASIANIVVSIFLITGYLLPNAAYAALNLNGVALYSELGEDQFIAGLYVEDLSKDSKTLILSDQRKHMVIKVLADRLLSRKFQRQWIEGVAINAGNRDLTQHAQNLADFSNMLKVKLIKNDTLTIERTFRRGVIISINGVTLGSIADKSFFDLLLRTWIGPVPLSSDFKESLLQGGSIDSESLARFDSVRTTSDRVNDLTAAITAKNTQEGNKTGINPLATETTNTQLSTNAKTSTSNTVPSKNIASTDLGATKNSAAITTIDTNKAINKSPKNTQNTAGDDDLNDERLPSTAANADSLAKNVLENEVLIENENQIQGKQPQDKQPIANEALVTESNAIVTSNNQIAATNNPPNANTTSIDNQIINNDIFDDDDDDFSYTAADLLSRQLYISKLTKWTGEKVKYPKSALRRNDQGTVRVSVVINKRGRVLSQEITSSSNIKSLDKAAIKAIKNASPYPAVPDVLGGDTFEFTVPIVFSLR